MEPEHSPPFSQSRLFSPLIKGMGYCTISKSRLRSYHWPLVKFFNSILNTFVLSTWLYVYIYIYIYIYMYMYVCTHCLLPNVMRSEFISYVIQQTPTISKRFSRCRWWCCDRKGPGFRVHLLYQYLQGEFVSFHILLRSLLSNHPHVRDIAC